MKNVTRTIPTAVWYKDDGTKEMFPDLNVDALKKIIGADAKVKHEEVLYRCSLEAFLTVALPVEKKKED